LDHEFHKSAKLISTLSLLTNQYNRYSFHCVSCGLVIMNIHE